MINTVAAPLQWAEIGDSLEIIRPWLSTGFLGLCVLILGMILRHQIQLRRVGVEATKVDNEDEVNIRDHYASEVAALRSRLDSQSRRYSRLLAVAEGRGRQALRASEVRHDECVKDRDDLRDKIWALKDQVSGLIRLLLQNSAAGTLILSSDEVSQHVREAAERVDRLFAPSEGKPK